MELIPKYKKIQPDIPFIHTFRLYFNGYSVKSQYMEHNCEKILLHRLNNNKTIPRYANMNYTQRLRDLREDSDLNQTQVAAMLHVGQTTYSDYENGKVRIPIEHFIALAQYYDVSLDYMAGITDIRHRFPEKK